MKFKDAELLGVPWIVVVGRGWADGVVELRNRFTGETREVAVDGAAADDRRGARLLTASRVRDYSDPPGKAAVIGHTPSTLFQRAAVTAALSQRLHREGALLGGRRLLQHRPPGDRGVLFHPHREVRRVGRVVDLGRH